MLLNIYEGEDKSSPLKNRIRKNYKHIRKWAQKNATTCFRIYDQEIKEYPFSIDFYDGRFCVHHYLSKKTTDERCSQVENDVKKALITLFNIDEVRIYMRTRIKREKLEQYEKKDSSKSFFTVQEYGAIFKVNLQDYLDTGLFLDHRETRRYVASLARGKKLLNLFAYTCSFSVHAALQGALFTKSVDMSNTYTEWGRDNFILNKIDLDQHLIVREDCLKFLFHEKITYDLIVIDPPTLSRSKKMEELFDIQKDYSILIKKCIDILNPNGLIFFSTNSRKFHFDISLFPMCLIEDITLKTIPQDFHNKKIHYCWKISLRK